MSLHLVDVALAAQSCTHRGCLAGFGNKGCVGPEAAWEELLGLLGVEVFEPFDFPGQGEQVVHVSYCYKLRLCA